MSTDNFDPTSLIDRKALADAEARVPELISRMHQAKADIEAAAQRVRDAEEGRRAAAVAGGSVLTKAMRNLTAAREEHAQISDVETDVQRAFAEYTQKTLPAAKRRAHAKLDEYALAERRAAAADGDAARAALAAADARMVAANAMFGRGGYDASHAYLLAPIAVQPHEHKVRWTTEAETMAVNDTLRAAIERAVGE